MTSHLPNTSGIYIIESTLTKKVYVGSSKNIKKRAYMHFYYLNKNQHHSKRLQSFINKHGNTSISIRVLEECDIDSLYSREQHWIDVYDSYVNGFNGTPEAYTHKNKSITQEHKLAISNANKGRKKSVQALNSFYNNCVPASRSETANKKRSVSNKGKKMSKESVSKRLNTIKQNGGLVKTSHQRQVASKTMKRLNEQKLLNRRSKLNDAQVSEIRHKSSLGVTGKALAIEYNVNPSVISRIINMKLH